MNERIDQTINKLVLHDFKLQDLEELKPHLGSSEFTMDYNLAENIKTIIVNDAREEIKSEIMDLIKEEKSKAKKVKVINIQTLGLKSIAACFLIICTISVIYTASSYNNEKHFSKPNIYK